MDLDYERARLAEATARRREQEKWEADRQHRLRIGVANNDINPLYNPLQVRLEAKERERSRLYGHLKKLMGAVQADLAGAKDMHHTMAAVVEISIENMEE